MSYLDELNLRQREAAQHTDGPLLIIAGAGAGKTKTITHRIAHLIEQGVAPHRILAVTFTNKAAGEMRERVRALLERSSGPHHAGGRPLVATFHALGVRLLREFHEAAGLPRAFSIWDRDDSVRTIKRILSELDDESMTPRAVLSAISRHKGKGETPASLEAQAQNHRERHVAHVWQEYEAAMREEGALDFDDLLGRTLALLRSNSGVLDRLQKRYTHLTIDEYQDTNGVQYEIARLLAGESRNLCVVGDIDQNIYSWRGAELEHLLEFETTFPGAKVVTLEQNYRSTRTILAAADAVIQKNRRRKPKTLFTDNETGEPIELFAARNEVEEAWFVAAKARELLQRGTNAGEIAILYRENFQSRALEEALLHAGVPYRVLGTKFFERKEVKDVLSYLRAALNPKSRADLARAAGTPARGIGPATLKKWFEGEAIAGAAGKKTAAFRETLEHIAQAAHTLPASEAVRYCIDASGIGKLYASADTEEAKERLENIRELVNVAVKYEHETPPTGIEQLLEEAALQSDQDGLANAADAVALMTVHASKGLEFDAVFITGLEQGLFPSMRESPDRDAEEERRLFYVAVTRARKRLFLSFAHERFRYGSREHTVPSEFLEDIDDRLIVPARREQDAYAEDIIT